MTSKFTKNLVQIFCAVLLFTGFAQGAAFQYGGLRLDLLTVTSSSSTVVLTKSHRQVNVATGSSAQVYKLPDATTLSQGYWFDFVNESSGTLTISNSSSVAITTLAQNESAFLWVKSTATTGGPWTYQKASASSGSGSGGGVRFTLSGATVPFTAIDGAHYQTSTQSLTTVNISMLDSGTSGSTVIQVNQYRSGSLLNSATASLTASSGAPASTAASLSGTLSLASGDILTVDVNSVALGTPSELSVEY